MKQLLTLLTLLCFSINMMAQSSEYEKVLVSGVFKNAKAPTIVSDEGDSCKISFISNDGNDNTFERVSLKFTEKRSKRMNINGQSKLMKYDYTTDIYADTLVLCQETRKYKGKPDVRSHSYYVYGDCRFMRSYYYNDEGDIIKQDGFIKSYKGKIEITSDLYNYLKELMGDEIQYKVISDEIDGDLEKEVMINGLPF